jgi:hypothetical protein
MALRQIISKLAMPAFEKDLARAMTSELAQAEHMVDCLLAPQVFAYAAPRTTGAFQQTTQVQAPVSKVEIIIQKEGLFQDAPSWHK